MDHSNGKIAGALLFAASVQFIICMIISEALYPGYSVSLNYISDLGVGSSSSLFNSSVSLLGVITLIGAYFVYRALNSKLFLALLVLTGIGATGVGFFPETAGSIHAVFSLIVFLFGGISAIYSARFGKSPFSYLSVILGIMTLMSLGLFALNIDLGLGVGGIERMVAYATLLWAVGFGGHLIAFPADSGATSKR